jgi:hypothetical protein
MPNFIGMPEVDKGKVRIRECPLLNRTVGNPFIRSGLDSFCEVAPDIDKTGPREVA